MTRAVTELVAVEGDPDSPVWLVQGGRKRVLTAPWPDMPVVPMPLLAIARLPNGSPVLARELRAMQQDVKLKQQ